ncbi:nodulation protein NfeD [Massilia sp. IC2-477]|uniref:NfeD family protein n=1 Tax=Massilia sp. IC2-477 TaxID=2887198 RepID=UPI001D1151F9|nr:nodulation protein NfeD [Massilia sp. IC2-477]MCC2956289.1 nodulation protein NfeD [Massilia sp. IC2-477]
MRHTLASAGAAIILLIAALLPAAAAPPAVGLLDIDGAIGPASADHVVRSIERSAALGHGLLILRMDTPGGLDTSMRTVIKAILASPVPVATWVAPSGARAASAGTYILYASHVAAMAPGTNVGAATPVEVGLAPPGDAGKDAPKQPSPSVAKATNDAAAYLRSLAQLRGRNADWAERAVRESVSLSADDALKLQVIDVLAPDLPTLLASLEGRTVSVLGQPRVLHTGGAVTVSFTPDWRTNALGAIANPSVALLLMTVGLYGLVFEFMNPGAVAPGVIGAICLLLGLYALQLLPVNYAGLALIVLGLAFMGAEAFLPSFGILGLGGVAAFVAGALMLIDTELPGYGIPPGLVGTLATASALLLFGTVRLAVKTRRRPVTSGAAGLIGMLCTVEQTGPRRANDAWVRVEGELWRAVSSTPLAAQQQVRIVGRDGLTLEVVPADGGKVAPS